MGRFAACALILGACFSPQPPTGAPCPDGVCPSSLMCSPVTMTCEKSASMIDAPETGDTIVDTPPTPDGAICYGTSGFVSVCPTMSITQPLSIVNATTIETDTSPSCIPYTGTGGLCVLAGTVVTISRGLRAQGTKPLAIIATDSIMIGSNGGAGVDVASLVGQPAGAGANAAACGAPVGAAGQQGGAGGSFGGVGGRGADLESPNGPMANTAATVPVTSLRGGCRGGSGAGMQVATGGNGGGAVILIATNTISIAGIVNASGAGGAGAIDRSGGGGGGSGGMIILDATNVSSTSSARIFANGGGGGEGGTFNHDGNPGANATAVLTGAPGGAALAPHGGDGGAGSANTVRNGVAGGMGNQCGGAGGENGKGGGAGGGGGSAGIIRIFATSQSIAQNTISPAPN